MVASASPRMRFSSELLSRISATRRISSCGADLPIALKVDAQDVFKRLFILLLARHRGMAPELRYPPLVLGQTVGGRGFLGTGSYSLGE